jgi:hypothetical protein
MSSPVTSMARARCIGSAVQAATALCTCATTPARGESYWPLPACDKDGRLEARGALVAGHRLGFYDNADGGHHENVITIGDVESGPQQLDDLEHGPVTVELIE